MISMRAFARLQKEGHTVLSDASLRRMKKEELILYIRCLENNWYAALDRCDMQYKLLKEKMDDNIRTRDEDM